MIRPARPEDAGAIDRVHVRAWHRAYADFMAPEDMPDGRRDEEERLEVWGERIGHPEVRTWVFDLDGFVAGFAAAGGGELWALYVDPGAQGAGVGTQLLAHAEEELRDAGAAEAVLWVYSANEHGRRFYESRGWRFVSGSERQGDRPAPHVEYRKAL